MSSDLNLEAIISADASGIKTGMKEAEQAVASSTSAMGASGEQLASSSQSAAQRIAAAFKSIAAQHSAAVQQASATSTNAAQSMASSLGGAVSGVQGGLGALGTAIGFVGKNFGVLAGVVAGAGIFKEGISATKQFTGEAMKLSKAMGTTASEAAIMNVALGDVGVSTDEYSEMSRGMMRQLKMNEQSMKNMGLETRTSSGAYKDMGSLMKDAAKVLGEYKEGTDQTLAAQVLFGRGVSDVGAIMKAANANTEEAKAKAEALGLTVGVENVKAAKEYKMAMHEVSDVSLALKKVIGDAVMPIFTELSHWLSQIGPTAVAFMTGAMDILVTAWQGLRETIVMVGDIVKNTVGGIGDIFNSIMGGSAISSMELFKNTIKVVQIFVIGFRVSIEEMVNFVGTGISILVNHLRTFAEIAVKAFHLDWAGVKSAWQKGVDDDIKILKSGTDKMVEIARKGATDMDAAIMSSGKKVTPTEKKDQSEKQDFVNPKEKKSADDLMKQLESELSAEKVGNLSKEGETVRFQEYTKQMEMDFWQSRTSLAEAGSKAALAIQLKINTLKIALAKDAFELSQQKLKDEESNFKSNMEAKLLLAQKYAANVLGAYGKDSKQYEAAQKEIVTIHKQMVDQLKQIDDEHAKTKEAHLLDDVAAEQEASQLKLDLGLQTKAQSIAQEQVFEAQITDIKRKGLMDKLALAEKDPDKNKVEIAKINAEIEQLEITHQAKLRGIINKAVIEQQAPMMTVSKTLETSLATSMNGILMKTMTWKQAMGSIFSSLGQSIITELAVKPIAETAVSLLRRTAMYKAFSSFKLGDLVLQSGAETAAGAKEIATDATVATAKGATTAAAITENTAMAFSAAALAAVNAMASVAAIPFVGWAMAPEVGDATYAQGTVFAGLASARNGFDIPAGVNPITQLHEREMVLPQKQADAVRSMAESGGSGGGDVHFHSHSLDQAGVKQWFKDNYHTLAPGLRQLARNATSVKTS